MGRKKNWKRIWSAWHEGQNLCSVHLARQYLEEFPDDPHAWIILGDSLTSLMRFDEARSPLLRAVRLLPPERRDQAYQHLGHLYREKGAPKTAEGWYRKALEACPEDAGYMIFLGTCLVQEGKLEEARQLLGRASDLESPVRDEAWFNLGGLNVTEEKYDEAAECYEKALQIDPKYKAAKRALAELGQWKKLARKKAR